MSDIKPKSEKKDLKTALSLFLFKYRIVFLVLISVILVFVVGVAIYTGVHQNRVENSAIAAEELQQLFEDWSAAPEEEKSEKEEKLIGAADDILDSFKGMYAAQRARIVLGGLYYRKGEWNSAIEQYTALADNFPGSYLAPVALMSAAVAYEQTGANGEAISMYQRVRENYSESFPDVSYALFSIGRLYEKDGEIDAAIEAYNEVVDNFSSSSWTNPSHNRIIYLKAMN